MLIAYNNDVKYQEKWYHIQTEDNGMKDGHITTTVFFSGQILDSKSTSYKDAIADISGVEAQNAVIKKMMDEQHRQFYDKLTGGNYDALVAQRISSASNRAQPRTSSPSIGAIPPISRTDANNVSGFSKAGKPDIVRASSQQLSSPGNALGIKAIGLGQKLPPSQPPLPSIHSAGGALRRPPAQPSNTQPDGISRQASPATPIPVSRAVTAYQKAAKQRAFRGVKWPESDLAVDMLVATLMDTITE